MKISGKILEIFDTQQIKDSFRKREFVLEYAENPQYPEFLKFETIQSNCDRLDQVKVGDEVEVQFNLKGRKWTDPQGNTKYFNSLQAWRIDAAGSGPVAPDAGTTAAPGEPDIMGQSFSEDDDLPF